MKRARQTERIETRKCLFGLAQARRSLMVLARWLSAEERSCEPAQRCSKGRASKTELKAK